MFAGWIEWIGATLDLVGVIVIALGLLIAALRYVFGFFSEAALAAYQKLRQDIGRAILLGLEILVAADIIRTVAVTPTLNSVIILGVIVMIRTFLSLSMQVEIEGRFPWQKERVGTRDQA